MFLGDMVGARAYWLEVLKLVHGRSDENNLERSILTNLGVSHARTGETSKAQEYFDRALQLTVESDVPARALILNSEALAKDSLGDQTGALELFSQVEELRRRMNDKQGEATTLANIGAVLGDKKYGDRANFKGALAYFEKSLALRKEIGDVAGEASTLGNVGATLTNLGGVAWSPDGTQLAVSLPTH